TEVAMLDASGRPLGAAVDVGALSKELGAPTIAIHRARLHQVLLDAAGVTPRLGATVVSYEARDAGVTVRTTAGDLEAELLIGAALKAELAARFAGWHAPIADVIAATAADEIVRTDIRDRDPIASWHSGRVVLLGDAAHPMTPNYGQGGCQAIEDAIVLDRQLA